MVTKKALVIALSWLLLVAFIAVSAEGDDAGLLPKASKNMVYYPQAGCRCCWFIWKPLIRCGKACCVDGCCSVP
ncbi:hypothetical protein L6164_032363 [Bauhinia variegata]|uniref:Uncharacterized protein n=1 Tax=Bauhinia variegata TaxID=167791 RepID=A0ACB9KNN8_BAUVA|nr:hypothetical protein L6164_032363 [Bauhinia variegata]